MSEFNKVDAYRINTLELAEHHRRCCDGESCAISLWLLKEMGEVAGVKFSDEEAKLFI